LHGWRLIPISIRASRKLAQQRTNDGGSAHFKRSITANVTEVFANNVAGCAELVVDERRGHEAHRRQNEFLIVDRRPE
jgi:hypothetical protein